MSNKRIHFYQSQLQYCLLGTKYQLNKLFVSAIITPFKLTVVTNADEDFGTAADADDQAIAKANVNEASGNEANSNSPLGTIGFSLQYKQQDCTQ